jgi:thioredoxin reductase (NADPH)
MIQTDIIIIGAGPVGLFTVFEAGLLKLKCHLIDSLPQAGGQCSEIYPKKPIYDIPGFPSILAGELIDNLMEQAAPFKPGFTLGEAALSIDKTEEGKFIVTTVKGTKHEAPIVIIAGGLGVFEPRKPPISNITDYEDNGVEYIIKDPEFYRGKRCVVAGGGDSALDWSIFLTENKIASEVVLVHRNSSFRGHLDSVQKVIDLAEKGEIRLVT